MARLVILPEEAKNIKNRHGFFDDFQGFLTATSTAKYTVVTVTDGTVLQTDSQGGGVAIKSAAASAAGNEDCYLAREAETFKPGASTQICFGALVQATEDDTNQNNLIVGMTDAVAADLLLNDGGGPKASGTTMAFYKVDGGLNWWVHASNSTTQTKVELTAVNSLNKTAMVGSGSSNQLLEIEYTPRSSTTGDILFKIDGVNVYKIADWVHTSATDMQAVCGCKDGDAGDEVTINLKAWYCYQAR